MFDVDIESLKVHDDAKEALEFLSSKDDAEAIYGIKQLRHFIEDLGYEQVTKVLIPYMIKVTKGRPKATVFVEFLTKLHLIYDIFSESDIRTFMKFFSVLFAIQPPKLHIKIMNELILVLMRVDYQKRASCYYEMVDKLVQNENKPIVLVYVLFKGFDLFDCEEDYVRIIQYIKDLKNDFNDCMVEIFPSLFSTKLSDKHLYELFSCIYDIDFDNIKDIDKYKVRYISEVICRLNKYEKLNIIVFSSVFCSNDKKMVISFIDNFEKIFPKLPDDIDSFKHAFFDNVNTSENEIGNCLFKFNLLPYLLKNKIVDESYIKDVFDKILNLRNNYVLLDILYKIFDDLSDDFISSNFDKLFKINDWILNGNLLNVIFKRNIKIDLLLNNINEYLIKFPNKLFLMERKIKTKIMDVIVNLDFIKVKKFKKLILSFLYIDKVSAVRFKTANSFRELCKNLGIPIVNEIFRDEIINIYLNEKINYLQKEAILLAIINIDYISSYYDILDLAVNDPVINIQVLLAMKLPSKEEIFIKKLRLIDKKEINDILDEREIQSYSSES